MQPPFPFESVLYGFLFLVPMSFIVQVYASSVIDERLDYSGELLLVTPASRADIIIGKTLPYALSLFGITVGLAAVLGASIASIYAVMTIAVAFLSIGFITGIFARSYKELSFVLLTSTIGLFGFVLIPAVFTTIHPIAIISPLTVVVADLQGDPLGLVDILFATGPLLLTGLILFTAGAGIYREDDLFTQRPAPLKLLDMLAVQISSWKSLVGIGMGTLPFVFAAQLLMIAILFVLPQALALPILLIMAALIEEVAKSLPVYAGLTNGRLRTRATVVLAALASGAGFFLAEQATTVVQLVGLTNLDLGAAVFETTLASVTGTPLGLALPVLWLAIHPLTTAVSAASMRFGRRGYAGGLLLATAIHVLYNYGVMLYA